MAADLAIVVEDDAVLLGEIIAPSSPDEIGAGQPVRVLVRNTGDTRLRDISIDIEGNIGPFIQLAVDQDGEPGIWADAGRGIAARSEKLDPGEEFHFWARGVYSLHDVEGKYQGEFSLKAISVGVLPNDRS